MKLILTIFLVAMAFVGCSTAAPAAPLVRAEGKMVIAPAGRNADRARAAIDGKRCGGDLRSQRLGLPDPDDSSFDDCDLDQDYDDSGLVPFERKVVRFGAARIPHPPPIARPASHPPPAPFHPPRISA